ncbi:MAG: DNA methylase N-4 [Chloroflexota bacterium]|nr:MAG: DNA methylase N-4 [Chloroflexota bacterium]
MSYERLRPAFTFDAERLEQLKAIAPEAFADGKVNWNALRGALGDFIEDEGADAEHFGLFWPGKRAARRRASEASIGTLIPVLGEGVNEDTTRNIFIEADNLDALKLLQKAYAGRVKMIFVDPPYNTGSDFVYRDDFRESQEDFLLRTGQIDEKLQPLTTNAKSDGRFHSNWLNMIYPRLLLARTLLRDDGAIFISIDDNEFANLRQLMDEVFGAENFVATVIWQHSLQPKGYTSKFSVHHNYIVIYAKSDVFEITSQERSEQDNKNYSNPDNDPNGLWRAGDVRNALYRPNLIYNIVAPNGNIIEPPPNGWRWSRETVAKKIASGEIIFNKEQTKIIRKIYLSNVSGRAPETIWFGKDVGTTRSANSELKQLFGDKVPFDTPKPFTLIQQCLKLSTEYQERHIIVDFFAGSGTTAQAVMEQNAEDGGDRQFIMVQLPEAADREFRTIAAIAAERIRRAGKKVSEVQQGKLPNPDAAPLDVGFRFYKYANSNYKIWQDYSGENPAQLQTLFDQFETPLIDGWQTENLLAEVMLQLGFPLDSTIETLAEFSANALQQVSSDFHAHNLFVCFDATIADETINALVLGSEDIFVCLDSALTDESKARLSDVCNLRTI